MTKILIEKSVVEAALEALEAGEKAPALMNLSALKDNLRQAIVSPKALDVSVDTPAFLTTKSSTELEKQKYCDCKNQNQCWEPCGELGHGAEHVKVHQQEHGNAEDMYIEMHKHLNCPHCGGSGHIEDVKQEQGGPVGEMTPRRAEMFMTRFKHEEKMLGPNEQAALDYVIAMLVAKQEQGEPVAWIYKGEPYFDGDKWCKKYELTDSKQLAFWKDKDAKPLYTTPYIPRGRQQRKTLTDEQILNVARDHYNPNQRSEISFARAIEAAHGIKE